MTDRTDEAPHREVIARWCTLAERRLNYLIELFESGRWRRYYTEAALLEDITNAKSAVKMWRDLSTPHLVPDPAASESTPALAQGVAAVELALSESAVPLPPVWS
jgi:uncharacterized repeat protein (TIGR03809 family)